MATDHSNVQEWLQNATPLTRLVVKGGVWAFIGAMLLLSVEFYVSRFSGWGTVSLLPGWAVGLIHAVAVLVGLCMFYGFLAIGILGKKRFKWGFGLMGGAIGYVFTALALGQSLPSLTTFVAAEPVEIVVELHKVSDGVRRCRGNLSFGPWHRLAGSMCLGHQPLGLHRDSVLTMTGHGNAFAVRVDRIVAVRSR